MNILEFYKAPKELLSCKGFVCSDGSVVTLSPIAKLVLIYMLDRNAFFVSSGKKHFETQETIGLAVGVESRAAAKALRDLVSGGFITASKVRNLDISPHMCWYYECVNTDVVLVPFEHKRRTTRESRCKKDVDIGEIGGSLITIEDEDEFLKSLGD